MSDSDGDFKSWQPPSGGGSQLPIEPNDKLWLYGKLFLIFMAEAGNWLLHFSNYSLSISIGSDQFLLDILGLPSNSFLSNVTVGMMINGFIALASIMTPIYLFGQLLDRHQEIFANKKAFFTGLNAIVTGMLITLYIAVITVEFSTLFVRIKIETAPSIIPEFATNPQSTAPLIIMAVTLIIANACFGLAAAHVIRSTKLALRS
jgi:hypothetical protein